MKKIVARRALVVAITVAFGGAASPAGAVLLDPDGTGQVLVYPYYTVNHQQTLISVVNGADEGKAIKIRFREGYDGREVASFNVYLAQFDSWVGAVFDTSADASGGAAVATSDTSCTVPQFDAMFFPNGAKVLMFSNSNYSSQGRYGSSFSTDPFPTDLSRTREGFVEIIEMGVVTRQSTHHTLDSIMPRVVDSKPAPPDCTQILGAWGSGGYWSADPSIDIAPPGGGLFGAAAVVDVEQGTMYTYDATAIDGFSDVLQHTAPGDTKPNLSTAVTDSPHDIATAYVPIGNAMIRADYPASTRGVDAVSAVMMADTLYNEFDVDAALGAATDWLVTFPTKQFYVDPVIVGTAETDIIAPFEPLPFGDHWACVGNYAAEFDRDGHEPEYVGCGYLCPASTGNYLCYETNVISFNALPTFFNGPSAALGSMFLASLQVWGYEPLAHGHAELLFDGAGKPMRPAIDGTVFKGFPAIGFAATNYINANVTPGVLSNYSGVYPHRSTASCTNSTNPQVVCQ